MVWIQVSDTFRLSHPLLVCAPLNSNLASWHKPAFHPKSLDFSNDKRLSLKHSELFYFFMALTALMWENFACVFLPNVSNLHVVPVCTRADYIVSIHNILCACWYRRLTDYFTLSSPSLKILSVKSCWLELMACVNPFVLMIPWAKAMYPGALDCSISFHVLVFFW